MSPSLRPARHPRPPHGSRRAASPLVRVVGVTGELLLTAGVLIVLFLAWQVVYLGWQGAREQERAVAEIEREFASGGTDPGDLPTSPPTELPTDPSTTPTPAPSTPSAAPTLADEAEPAVRPGPRPTKTFAILRIPRFGGPTWARPVYEGVDLPTIAHGPGHYPGTARPGQVGNVAIAGHRTTHGQPFNDIDRLVPGDVIVVETRSSYAVYRTQRSTIVAPTAIEVIAPVPERPGARPTQAWLTLTSCHPKLSARQRYIVFALLDRVIPRSRGLPASLLADPRDR